MVQWNTGKINKKGEVPTMADLQMLSYKLEDLQFFNKLEKAGQVQLENNSNFTVKYNSDATKCVAKLYQCVKDKTDNPDHHFFASVELVGLFQITGGDTITDEEKKEFHVRCYEQLFCYADTLVSRVCEAGGMPNFRLLRRPMTKASVQVKQSNQNK